MKLAHVDIPDNVKTIKAGAFAYCKSLLSVIVPSQVDVIDEAVFQGCTSLTISIPDSVSVIGLSAFSGCGH